MRAERDIYTVSRLNKEVRLMLESGLPVLWIEGELTNFADFEQWLDEAA